MMDYNIYIENVKSQQRNSDLHIITPFNPYFIISNITWINITALCKSLDIPYSLISQRIKQNYNGLDDSYTKKLQNYCINHLLTPHSFI